MAHRIRIGAVSYLNTRPLVHGLGRGPLEGRIELSYAPPATLADRMAAGALDIALLPVIELARLPDLELVPGLGIVTRGDSRSVLLVTKRPVAEVERVALDPESRTSNALCRVLFAELWGGKASFAAGPLELEPALAVADAVVRIGDKALFETLPPGVAVHDLGGEWTAATGLPFVFAVWAARPGIVDRELYCALHDARRSGMRAIDEIARSFTWQGRPEPEVVQSYLTRHIVYRLGSAELAGLRLFFDRAAATGVIDRQPEIRMALARRTACDEAAEQGGLLLRPAR